MSKKRSSRKPGLWFSATKAEVEQVNIRMSKPCHTCGDVPQGLRLKITKGSGRHQTTMVYCQPCGDGWIDEFKGLAQRAKAYLKGKFGRVASIRPVEE